MSLLDSSVDTVRQMPVSFEEMEMYDGAAVKHAANRTSTRKLLMALVYHHGTNANMSPPKGWVKREIVVEPPKVVFRSEKDIANEIDPLKIEEIKRQACSYFGISMLELVNARRATVSVRPRQIAMLMCKRFTARSYPEIGRRFGGRDHTTVLHAIRRIESMCMTDWLIAYDVAHLEANLGKGFQS
jgi:hypothetical protein